MMWSVLVMCIGMSSVYAEARVSYEEPASPLSMRAVMQDEAQGQSVAAKKLDDLLFGLRRHLTDGTLEVVVDSDRLRIPLLIDDLRQRIEQLSLLAQQNPNLYATFLDNMAKDYVPLVDKVPTMTFYHACWWRQQMVADAAQLSDQRSKLLMGGIDSSALDLIIGIYQDLARIVVPVAYMGKHGKVWERVYWWWQTASHHERIQGVGGVLTAMLMVGAMLHGVRRKKNKTREGGA